MGKMTRGGWASGNERQVGKQVGGQVGTGGRQGDKRQVSGQGR